MKQKRFTNLPDNDQKRQRRILRRTQTKGEQSLWMQIRNRKIGFKFRRQVSIGNCIVDFYCHELKLILEVDDGIHNESEQKQHDFRRDAWLKSKGFKILRVINEDCIFDMDFVLKKINEKVKDLKNKII